MVQIALETQRTPRQIEQFCQDILPQVSRTFALSIRFLPGNLGKAVLCGYLLARIADTIEDDPLASIQAKTHLLEEFLHCFDDPVLADRYAQLATGVSGEQAHLKLVHNTDQVFALYRSLTPQSQKTLRHWLFEMIRGMQKFVALYPKGLRVQTLEEYKEYCYYVAGTVGFLLTDLWYEHSPSVDEELYLKLRKTCAEFGEALQTVNILKDIAWDAREENAIYIPEASLREEGSSQAQLLNADYLQQNHRAIQSLVKLAWTDLELATQYLEAIPKSAVAIRLFCILPLIFAYATLRDITETDAMLREGGNVKISRAEVKSLILFAPLTVVSNHSIRWLVDRVRTHPFLLGKPAT
ncbi:phytoene/squalene synthase family protein [Lyngbya confervoides]|uniref:Phytoene/squalene synthase family protein n=1 Tax=Lyngbya confervoides BDU141951 TaxID=1574623 RepID=A0ABD4T6S1_9CYAN|nr:phytoene/squalene synthase family protein [Lyngbya confervoides]MCM1984148.1 phytoene/squalene synthase family protein [Lyngbya confervoides BDU141951]